MSSYHLLALGLELEQAVLVGGGQQLRLPTLVCKVSLSTRSLREIFFGISVCEFISSWLIILNVTLAASPTVPVYM